MLDILLKEEYGYLPPKPDKVTWVETDNYINCFCAGKATISTMVTLDFKCVTEYII